MKNLKCYNCNMRRHLIKIGKTKRMEERTMNLKCMECNDIKKNLLSIGKFDDIKCRINIKDEILKVLKDNLVVMKEEKITTNLYILLGDTL
ncbi:hypothetical protein CR513_59320, partial [Mucuna pruriens]